MATAAASACGGKTSRPIRRTIAWGRVGGQWQKMGWGCGAHLDRGDLRYQRKQARIVRRAGAPAVVAVTAVGGHFCVLLAALVLAVVGAVGIVGQVPPVALPVGAVLGVGLGPAGVREHAEPARVAVLALPSVCHNAKLIISEHAAAEDADAVEGVPIP